MLAQYRPEAVRFLFLLHKYRPYADDSDQAFALLLGMSRQLVLGDARVKEGQTYDVPLGEDLCAMTLGLLGCGHIGADGALRVSVAAATDDDMHSRALTILGARVEAPRDDIETECDNARRESRAVVAPLGALRQHREEQFSIVAGRQIFLLMHENQDAHVQIGGCVR